MSLCRGANGGANSGANCSAYCSADSQPHRRTNGGPHSGTNGSANPGTDVGAHRRADGGADGRAAALHVRTADVRRPGRHQWRQRGLGAAAGRLRRQPPHLDQLAGAHLQTLMVHHVSR